MRQMAHIREHFSPMSSPIRFGWSCNNQGILHRKRGIKTTPSWQRLTNKILIVCAGFQLLFSSAILNHVTGAQTFHRRKWEQSTWQSNSADSRVIFVVLRCSCLLNVSLRTIRKHRDQNKVAMSLAGFKKQINKANQVMEVEFVVVLVW